MPERWVRFTVPVMVEVDCKADEVTLVVPLPQEVREDRDDTGLLIYDERFRRRPEGESSLRHGPYYGGASTLARIGQQNGRRC